MKITEEQIIKIKQNTDLGKSAKEIALILNISIQMVEYLRRKNHWNSKYNSSILEGSLEEIKKLVTENVSDIEIAKIFKCSVTSVFRLRKKYNINRKDLRLSEHKEILTDMLEFLIGTLLGDSSLAFRRRSTRFSCEHSIKLKCYIEHKAELLKALGAKLKDTRVNTPYPAIRLQTKSTPSLNYLYDSFYKNGEKIIPFNLLDNFTERSLSYLFMDDGFPIKNKKGIVTSVGIALCNFSESELNNFILFLKNKFNLNFYISKHYNKYYDKYYLDIDLKSSDFNKFKEIVYPYLQDWALYKIKQVGS